MFQSLADKMAEAFKKFKGKGKLTEKDVKEGMREIKLALLEADVSFKVVKDFSHHILSLVPLFGSANVLFGISRIPL